MTEGASEQSRGIGRISYRAASWLAWSLWALWVVCVVLAVLLYFYTSSGRPHPRFARVEMRRRLEREDFMRAGRLTIGVSRSGHLAVCQEYEIQGDAIVAKWSRQEVPHWWWYNPLQEAPDLFLEFAALREASDFPEAALAFSHKRGLPGGEGFSSQPSAQITTQRESPCPLTKERLLWPGLYSRSTKRH